MDVWSLRTQLAQTEDVKIIQRLLIEIEQCLTDNVANKELARYKQLAMFQVNEFLEAATAQSVQAAKTRVIQFMQTLAVKPASTLSVEVARDIIRRILRNFNMYLEETFQRAPHARATIIEGLQQVEIGNEYDVQHLLYGLLKPIFPDARTEVVEDTGYGGIRYDIVIDTCDVTIETKCTRLNLNEKKLSEEIAADSFHYSKGHVFFFVYDSSFKVIRNKTAFESTYSKVMEQKTTETIVLQPITLS